MKNLWRVLIIVLLIVLLNQAGNAYAPKTENTILDYQYYLLDASRNYNISFHDLFRVVKCESNWKKTALGDSGKALGLAQYHKATFHRHAKFVDLEWYDYTNPYHQLDLMARAWSLGMSDEWSCKRIVGIKDWEV